MGSGRGLRGAGAGVRVAGTLVAGILVPAGCTGTTPGPAPTAPVEVSVIELPVTLDEGFERGQAALISPPPGFTATLDVVDGWGLLAETPKCVIRARTGARESEMELDSRALTADLLEALASRDLAAAVPTEAELNWAGVVRGEGLPVLEAAWESPDGPVRAVARVARSLSLDDLEPPTYRAVVAELRCVGEVDAPDLDAAWAHTLDALRIGLGPAARSWDPPHG